MLTSSNCLVKLEFEACKGEGGGATKKMYLFHSCLSEITAALYR